MNRSASGKSTEASLMLLGEIAVKPYDVSIGFTVPCVDKNAILLQYIIGLGNRDVNSYWCTSDRLFDIRLGDCQCQRDTRVRN